MRNLTAKDLENIYSKKQILSYNKILKEKLCLLRMDYKKVVETRDSYIENEVNRREKEFMKKESHDKKILSLKLRIYKDMIIRNEKKYQKELENMNTKLIERDEQLLAKEEEIHKRDEQILEKDKRIQELEKELAKRDIILNNNGTNSSIPTSQTPINQEKVIPNSREKSGKSKGGQFGHKKAKLEKFKDEEITETRTEKIEECCHCHSHDLKETGRIISKDIYEYRLVVDKIRVNFIESICQCCGRVVRKEIPVYLKEENQYGSSIQGLALGLMNIGNVPINKTQRIIKGLTAEEINLSEGYISKLQKRASQFLAPFIEELRSKIIASPQIYWDDTVVMVNKKRSCMRFYGDTNLALYKAHEKKNMIGLDKDGILNLLTKQQVVIHDHNKVNYNPKYDFMNVECNAHLLRDLQKVSDNIPERTWAKDLKEHIQKYSHKRTEYMQEGKDGFNEDEINEYFAKLDEYILCGYKENEEDSKHYYSPKEKTLLDRIIEYRDNYTYWVLDFEIPPTNNLSERSLRGVKTKMKVSGQFQNIEHAKYYADIRSYVETCHRNGINELEALQRLAASNPFTLDEILEYKKISKAC